jgi:ankyrin repeat protein
VNINPNPNNNTNQVDAHTSANFVVTSAKTRKKAKKSIPQTLIQANLIPFLNLPKSAIALIFSFSGQSNFAKLATVCKLFKEIIFDTNTVYKPIILPNPHLLLPESKISHFDIALKKYESSEISSKVISKYFDYENNIIQDKHRNLIFIAACKIGDKKLVQKYLLENKKLEKAVQAKINQPKNAISALQTVTKNSTDKNTSKILYNPLSPSVKKEAFQKAFENEKDSVVKLFLKNNFLEDFSKTELYDIFLEACKKGADKIVKSFLKDPSFNPTNPNLTRNAGLIIACEEGNEEVTKLLLNDGRMDPTNDSKTLLELASRHLDKNLVTFLLEDERVQLEAERDRWGHEISLLRWACANGNVGLIKKHFDKKIIGREDYHQILDNTLTYKKFENVRFLMDFDKDVITRKDVTPSGYIFHGPSVGDEEKDNTTDNALIMKILRAVCESNDEVLFDKIISQIPSTKWGWWVETKWEHWQYSEENPFYSAAAAGNINMFKKMARKVKESYAYSHVHEDIIEKCFEISMENYHKEFAEFICSKYTDAYEIFGNYIYKRISLGYFDLACKRGYESIARTLLRDSADWHPSYIEESLNGALKHGQTEIVKLIYENKFDKLSDNKKLEVVEYLRKSQDFKSGSNWWNGIANFY